MCDSRRVGQSARHRAVISAYLEIDSVRHREGDGVLSSRRGIVP